jgi:4-amino-4-deoxy-L-arabinose transferase-like glycosyltransferase
LKLVVVLQLKDHILLQPDAGLDTTAYTSLATRVVNGDLALGPGVYFVSPLYIYFLAAVLALGDSFTAARVVQAALGTAAVGLVFVAARVWVTIRAAWLAAVLAALTGIITFYEALLVQAALDPLLTAAGLAALSIALKREKARWYLASGFGFGLQVLNRPNVILALAGLLLVMLVARRVRPAAALAAGITIAVAPVTVRNAVVAGEWPALSSQGGLNFYIGNNPQANGTYRPVPGIAATIEGQQYDSRRVAEQAAGRTLTDREVSNHFFKLGLSWITQHPATAVGLFARKLAYVFNAGPVFLNFSYPFFAYDAGTLLAAMIVGPWLLIPLGLLGCVLAIRQDRRFAILASFIPLYAVSTALFFAADRYQLPLIVACAVAASGTLEPFRLVIASGDRASLAKMILVLVLLGVGVNWPFHFDKGRAEQRTRMSERLIIAGQYEDADRWALMAEEDYPNPAVLHFRVGRRFLLAHQPALALKHLERAHQLDPSQPEVQYRLGQAMLESGRPADAVGYLRSGLEARSQIDLAGYDLARALAATGDREGALTALQQVRPSTADPAQNDVAMGELALQLQAPGVAEPFFRRALSAQPTLASAHQQLGLTLGIIGRTDEAIQELGVPRPRRSRRTSSIASRRGATGRASSRRPPARTTSRARAGSRSTGRAVPRTASSSTGWIARTSVPAHRTRRTRPIRPSSRTSSSRCR